jgi:hypothetical protein
MANAILSTSTPLGNPVSEIAYLIDAALQERCHLPADIYLDTGYAESLATLVGLGFTAILAEGSRIRSCKPHLAYFLRYRHLTQQADKTDQLAMTLANIICNAIQPFRVLGFPMYYDDFVSALINVLTSPTAGSPDTKNGIKNILHCLFEKCS